MGAVIQCPAGLVAALTVGLGLVATPLALRCLDVLVFSLPSFPDLPAFLEFADANFALTAEGPLFPRVVW